MKTYRNITTLMMATAFFTIGCGAGGPAPEPGVVVTAKVLQGGSVIQSAVPGGTLQLNIVRLNEQGQTAEIFQADYGADGSVKFIGAGKGVQPGKYKLTVTESGMFDPINPNPDNKDMFGNKFMLPTTPFEFDIPADKVSGTHDLGTLDLADAAKSPAAKPPGT